MLMSNSQRAVFEYLEVRQGYASEVYYGRLKKEAYGVVTNEQIAELCKQDRHYFDSDIKINVNRYFYCKLYTD